MNPPRIVFMGTPAFAVGTLEALLDAGMSIAGVITAPDKPAGRGKQLQQSAVKQCALRHRLPVLQPVNLKDPVFLEELRQLNADLFVVVAFRMLPESVWAMPPLGTLNLHASLLPAYRGAAPINWAIIEGESETGVTTFLIEKEIDTGKILLQSRVPIPAEMNAGQLHDLLCEVGAGLVVRTVQELATGILQAVPQPSGENFPRAPKIFPADCQLNWAQPAHRVYDKLRGLAPYPAAWNHLDGLLVKLPEASPVLDLQTPPAAPGTLAVRHKRELWCAAADGWVQLMALKPEGKAMMPAQAFINGYAPNAKQLT
ncbi:MAG: methionyl-tRNA formyltransferase [Bacteroidetes bacterium]|nr:methionyl-tRNA formyltransferase [Bacteroidota bacterium]